MVLSLENFDQGGREDDEEDGWQENIEMFVQQPVPFLKNPHHAPAPDVGRNPLLHLALSLQPQPMITRTQLELEILPRSWSA
jgi:hypothetical protein